MHSAVAALFALASVFATTVTHCPMGGCAMMRAASAHHCCGDQIALARPNCCADHARVPQVVGEQGRGVSQVAPPVLVAWVSGLDLATPAALSRRANVPLLRIHAPPDSLLAQHTSLLI